MGVEKYRAGGKIRALGSELCSFLVSDLVLVPKLM